MPYSDTESSRAWQAVTPSDTVNFTVFCRAIYVGGAGTIVAVPELGPNSVPGTPVTFTGCLAGTTIPIRAFRINATGTTATNLVALF